MEQITKMGKEGHKLIKIIKLDQKGRFVIPKGIRKKYGDEFVLSEYIGCKHIKGVLVLSVG